MQTRVARLSRFSTEAWISWYSRETWHALVALWTQKPCKQIIAIYTMNCDSGAQQPYHRRSLYVTFITALVEAKIDALNSCTCITRRSSRAWISIGSTRSLNTHWARCSYLPWKFPLNWWKSFSSRWPRKTWKNKVEREWIRCSQTRFLFQTLQQMLLIPFMVW